MDDVNGTVNGSNTLIKRLNVTANGKPVYDCKYANHFVNIKNLIEYNPSYPKSVGTNEYYFLDTSRHADGAKHTLEDVDFRGGGNGNVLREVSSGYMMPSKTLNAVLPHTKACHFFCYIFTHTIPLSNLRLFRVYFGVLKK